MAGNICTGTNSNNSGIGNLRSSMAYCEGMTYRASGTLIGKPITGNPHDGLGSEAETAWDAGWAVAEAAKGGAITIANQGCCAVGGTVSA